MRYDTGLFDMSSANMCPVDHMHNFTGTECMKARFISDCESKRKKNIWKEAPGISSTQSETLERLTKTIALFATQNDLFVLSHKPRFHALQSACPPFMNMAYNNRNLHTWCYTHQSSWPSSYRKQRKTQKQPPRLVI